MFSGEANELFTSLSHQLERVKNVIVANELFTSLSYKRIAHQYFK